MNQMNRVNNISLCAIADYGDYLQAISDKALYLERFISAREKRNIDTEACDKEITKRVEAKSLLDTDLDTDLNTDCGDVGDHEMRERAERNETNSQKFETQSYQQASGDYSSMNTR